MSQAFIILADMHPMAALASGEDASVCGLCMHRGKIIEDMQREKMGLGVREKHRGKAKAPERSCYVNMASVGQVYNKYEEGGYRKLDPQGIKTVLTKSPFPIRLGAYGDPAVLPLELIDFIVRHKPIYTGYTALWELNYVQPYKKYLQASVPSIGKLYKARDMGWSTYRAAADHEPPLDFETICPFRPEAWEGRKDVISEDDLWRCDQCLICGGVGSIRQKRITPKHIVDPLHGGTAGHQQKRLKEGGMFLKDPYPGSEMYPYEGTDV